MNMDYRTYEMPKKEKLLYALAASVVVYITAYVFYHSHILSLLFSPLGILYIPVKTKDIVEKRKYELNLQFRDMLYSISSSLAAGKSIEMSFRDVLKDLSIIYPGSETMIIKEVEAIIKRLEVNGTIESALSDLAERAGIDDVKSFSEVFKISKRSGGNLIEVMKNTSGIINDKLEVMQEIEGMLAQRSFEQKILSVLPVIIIILLSITSSDYMEPVFNTFSGRITMSASILLLAAAYVISKKIMDIKI